MKNQNNNEESIYKKLNNLVNEEKLEKVDEKVKEVVTVISSASNNTAVERANIAYLRLDEEQKKLVTNKDKLQSMMDKLDEEVKLCVELINNINIDETNTDPNYMDDIEKKIDNAKSVFSKLTRKQQNKVGRTNKYKCDWQNHLENKLARLGDLQEALTQFDLIIKLIKDKTNWTELTSNDIDAVSIDNSSYYYSILTEVQKEFISNKSEYKKLISMIKEFDESECQINEVKNSIDNIPLLASDSKYADDVKIINEANSAYSKLNDYQQNKVTNKEKLFNALKELDKQNKIINKLTEKIKKKTFLSDEDKSDLKDILPRYVSNREEVRNINQLFDAVYTLFIYLVDKIKIDGTLNNENKKQIKYAIELYNLMPEELQGKGKSKYENLENMKKIVDVDDSIQRVLDSQLEKIDNVIKKVKEDYKNLDNEQKNKVSNYDELIKYETNVQERNKQEKEIEKYKDDLNKIKAPLKDLSNFEHNNSEDFSKKFNEQLLKGLDLCLKHDEQLQKHCGKQVIENLKKSLDENKTDKLKEICKEKWITFVSRDYLLFMINLIECKKFYLEDSKNNVIDYEDPKWNDSELTELKEKLGTEKNINNEVKTLINKLFSERDDGSKTVNNLKSVYAYVSDDKDIDPTDKKTLTWISEDWFIAKKHHKVLDKIIRSLENKQKEFDENKKLCIKALQILNRIELKEGSKLVECNIPVWKVENNKPSLSIKDLKQGEIGDCWLISALISIVKNNPENILQCFPNKENEIDQNTGVLKGDHITVRLYKVMLSAHRKKDGRLRAYARPIRPITIKMKSTIYERGNKLNFAWPKFIEKATSVYRAKKMLKLTTIDDNNKFEKEWLIELKNDWLENSEIAGSHNLEASTNDGIVMSMLLGNTSGGSGKDVFDDSLETIEFNDYLKANLDKFKKKNATVSFIKKFETNGNRVTNGHAYSITNVDHKNVYLTNPYDETKELEVPIDTFCEYCMGVTFGHSSQS